MNITESDIEKIRSDVAPILEKAPVVADVKDTESEARAVEFLSQIKLRLQKLEDARKFLVKPLNDHVKEINAKFKESTDPLSEADLAIRKGITVYRNSEAMREAQAEKARLVA